MEEINKLLEVTDRLLGPEGCPWDREQTMKSIRPYVLEEVCELIEAIDLEDNSHIKEELGDLFFNVIFLIRLAEKENRFDLKEVIKSITEKLIHRHPHVFGEKKIQTAKDVIKQWDHLKSQEKDKSIRKSIFDGIPKSLPALTRAKKIIKKMKKSPYSQISTEIHSLSFANEDELGKLLFSLVAEAEKQGLDSENALRKVLATEERSFRNLKQSKY
jgi:tetrapyrrole methylase family protein/MazG family protein